jgi:glycosyltransferase involved in cell wall biosynthesis
MKIAILGPVYPFRGGIAHHTAELARNLEKQGHQVDIFSFRKIYPAILFPGKTQFETLDTLYKVPSTRTFTPWNHWTWKNTVKLIDQGNYDVLLVV